MAHRAEVAFGVIARIGEHQRRHQHHGGVGQQQRGLVGGRGFDGLGRQAAARAGLVLHDHGRAKLAAQLVGHDAGHAVGGAAGGIAHHDPQRGCPVPGPGWRTGRVWRSGHRWQGVCAWSKSPGAMGRRARAAAQPGMDGRTVLATQSIDLINSSPGNTLMPAPAPAPSPPTPSPPPGHRLAHPQAANDLLMYRLNRLLAVAGSLVVRLCEGGYGITRREWGLLMVLAQHPGMPPAELAQRLGLDRARTSRAITSLLAKKLITRDAMPGDRRQARAERSQPAGHDGARRACSPRSRRSTRICWPGLSAEAVAGPGPGPGRYAAARRGTGRHPHRRAAHLPAAGRAAYGLRDIPRMALPQNGEPAISSNTLCNYPCPGLPPRFPRPTTTHALPNAHPPCPSTQPLCGAPCANPRSGACGFVAASFLWAAACRPWRRPGSWWS